jgi:hypothetical protein
MNASNSLYSFAGEALIIGAVKLGGNHDKVEWFFFHLFACTLKLNRCPAIREIFAATRRHWGKYSRRPSDRLVWGRAQHFFYGFIFNYSNDYYNNDDDCRK